MILYYKGYQLLLLPKEVKLLGTHVRTPIYWTILFDNTDNIIWYCIEIRQNDQLVRDHCKPSTNQIETTIFTRVMSKKALDFKQYSSSIWLVYSCHSHPRPKILVNSRAWVINTWKFCRQKDSKSQRIQRHKVVRFRQKRIDYPLPAWVKLLFCPFQTVPRCCRPLGSFANSWRAATFTVVFVSGFTPTFGWKYKVPFCFEILMQPTYKKPSTSAWIGKVFSCSVCCMSGFGTPGLSNPYPQVTVTAINHIAAVVVAAKVEVLASNALPRRSYLR